MLCVGTARGNVNGGFGWKKLAASAAGVDEKRRRDEGTTGTSSARVGSDSSSSTTASTKFRPVFFSPQPRHNTMVMAQGQRMIPQRDLMVKYSSSGRPSQELVTLGQYRQQPKKPGRRRKSKESGVAFGMPDVDLLASTVTPLHREPVEANPGANHYV